MNKVAIKDVIDKVSELYREELARGKEIYRELSQINIRLAESEFKHGTDLTVAEFNELQERKEYLERERDRTRAVADGIEYVREVLFVMEAGNDKTL